MRYPELVSEPTRLVHPNRATMQQLVVLNPTELLVQLVLKQKTYLGPWAPFSFIILVCNQQAVQPSRNVLGQVSYYANYDNIYIYHIA